jgi:ArsR family transcriptional regulator, nickel/cobalt-responsive transcriptional repressor
LRGSNSFRPPQPTPRYLGCQALCQHHENPTCTYVHVTMYWVSNGQSGNVGVTPEQAERIARVMAGLATPSRIRLLSRLRQGPSTVTALAATVGMTQPAVSHQLRVLRDLGLVIGRRDVRHIVYSLHDAHVAALLDATLRHAEQLGWS